MTRFGGLAGLVVLGLSALVLALGVAATVYELIGPGCFVASESEATLLALTPLVVLGTVLVTLTLDIRALLSGGETARAGRWALLLLGVGVALLVWSFIASIDALLTCDEGI